MNIGRTIVTNRFANTIDSFWFVIEPNVIVNPFDFVTVEHIHDTKSIGMVQYSRTFVRDESTSGNAISYNSAKNPIDSNAESAIIARAVVMATTSISSETNSKSGSNVAVNMPAGLGRPVRFANAEEIKFALGVPDMADPVPAGIIENSDGLTVPVALDISYLLGPDTAHVNASGISGNSKTSYLMFLLQSTYQKLQKREEFILIIFNTKNHDLLHIHEDERAYRTTKEKYFSILDLELKPFQNVTYFLPRGKDGRPDSLYVPQENSKTYSYELKDVYDRLDLLFSEIYDPQHNLSSIINYIYEYWPIGGRRSAKRVKTWTDLYKFKDFPSGIITHKSTLLYFQAHLRRFKKSSLFVDRKVTSTYLGNEIKGMYPGAVFVIDIAMLSLEEQSFVIGDVMKSIDKWYAARLLEDYQNEQLQKIKAKYVLIFIDEINRFLPKDRPEGKLNAVAEQIMRSLIAGRSRGTILFSAQQFKSAVEYTLHENTGTHVFAKLGRSELDTFAYNAIDKHTKSNIVRLNKGELVLLHPAFRYPIKIKFPQAWFGN